MRKKTITENQPSGLASLIQFFNEASAWLNSTSASSTPEEVTSYKAVQEAVMRGEGQKVLKDIIKNINIHLVKSGDSSTQPLYYLPPYLHECACCKFDRINQQRRKQYEDKLIQFAKNNLYDKNNKINYLGFGSGGLLQDFILLYRFIDELGFRYFNVVVIEPYGCGAEQIGQLQDMLSAYSSDIKIEITSYKTVDECLQAKKLEKFDIINGSDFDDFIRDISDVMLVSTLLNESGRFFISGPKEDYQFSIAKCVENTFVGNFPENLQSLKQDILALHSNNQNKDIFYCGISKISCLEELARVIIPAIQQSGYTKFFLTLPENDQKYHVGISSFLNKMFPLINFIFNWIDEEKSNNYGAAPVVPIFEANHFQKIKYDMIYWSTRQSTAALNSFSLDTDNLGPFSKNECYDNTIIIVDRPVGQGEMHFRMHPIHGYKIYLSPYEGFDAQLKQFYESLYPQNSNTNSFIRF